MTEENEKICFVIAPIDEPDSETRKRSDQILKYIISPAVEARGYKAVRADELERPGMITSQVIQHVIAAPLVVADLTDRNPNVFYELAVRHAIRKPFIQIIRKGETIPFDVAGARTIFVDHRDLDSVEAAKSSILEQVDFLEENSSEDIETPISSSLDLQYLQQSKDPEQRSLADILPVLSEIRRGQSNLEDRLMMNLAENSANANRLAEQMSETVAQVTLRGQSDRKQRVDSDVIFRMLQDIKTSGDINLAVPILVSPFQDEAPWLYELGMALYEQLEAEDWSEAANTAKRLMYLINSSMEVIEAPPTRKFLAAELRKLLDRVQETYSLQGPPPYGSPDDEDDLPW